jgi:hypothetical protein
VTSKANGAKPVQISVPGMPSLTIEAGHGLIAIVHDGYLQLQQSDDEGTDTLMLSRSEARMLFETFEEWANG